MAARSPAEVLVYGGAAGGGKSFFQAYRAAKHHKVKGYNAALFRRTSTMMQGSGSLWDECMGFYPALGASFTTRPLEFTWTSPARVEFRHLQHETSAQEHKSKQYAYLGFDEATDFTGTQFTFMHSRLRTVSGVPKQFVLTTNPDPDSYLRTWIDWWIGSDGFPDLSRSGKIRYFVRVKDEIVWSSSREDLVKYVDGPNEVKSFTFIAASVYDNKALLEKDKTYLGNLKALPEVERARYLGGNWDVKESAGDMFQQSWFRLWYATELERTLMQQDGPGARIVQLVRWWDFAATPVKGDLVPGIDRPSDFKARDPGAADPDWSVGVLLARTADGRIIVLDVKAFRDTPGAIEAAIERQAMEDGPKVVVGWWQDVGQAAISQTEHLKARISKHATVVMEPSSKSKMEYAREPSRASYRGEILYLQAKWNAFFFNQLQQFPTKGAHDDCVDALSGAWHYLSQNPCFTGVPLRNSSTGGVIMPGDADFMLPPTRDRDLQKRPGGNRFGRRIL
jgi:predicted phage terminase large subunit-like protein